MRSANIKIDQEIFFELLGMKYFQGDIVSIKLDHTHTPRTRSIININVLGDDDRLPEKDDYPECCVECKQIQSHFKEIK